MTEVPEYDPTPVTPDTIRTRWSGEALDLDLAVTALHQPRPAPPPSPAPSTGAT